MDEYGRRERRTTRTDSFPERVDVALLVPFQPRRSGWVDPTTRAVMAPTQATAIRAQNRLLEVLGLPVSPQPGQAPHRSLTAVALATCLEKANLRWRVEDPGPIDLRQWRAKLEGLCRYRPRVVAISTTFVVSGWWIGALCEMVRRILPDTCLAVGGYYYATDTKQFLSLDADVLAVGEGERRLPQLVEAVRDGAGLDHIPGLYLRKNRGPTLRYTGDAEPLRLEDVPQPDWSLSPRIDPPYDPARDRLSYTVETQRGCVYKCEYCTYRTLSAPVTASVDFAVRALRNVPAGGENLFLADPTGTFPRERFKKVMERLIELGGCPSPGGLYARVADLDDELCALMARAGFTSVVVGQESGDQRMLNEMRKGTKVSQIKPAVAALGRHGLESAFCMIFGFPGETLESMAATRRAIVNINEGWESSPVVRSTGLHVFDMQDFAAVSRRDEMADGTRRYSYDFGVTPARAAEERLLTWLEMSRVPHAPWSNFGAAVAVVGLFDHKAHRDPLDFFRWMKAIDRATGYFIEQELEGHPVPEGELSRLRAEILHSLRPDALTRSRASALATRVRHRMTWRVLDHWAKHGAESSALTRAAMTWEVGRATGRIEDALSALETARFPALGIVAVPEAASLEASAQQLVQLGVETGRRRLAKTS